MKNHYISNEQMELHLKKGRHERSKALAAMFIALSSSIKKHLPQNSTNPPKATVCEQTA